MNKFFKYGLITAGISMAAGIVFTLIATIIGGKILLSNSGWLINRLNRLGILEEFEDWQESFYADHHNGDWHLGWGGEDYSTELKINGEIQHNMTIEEPGEISAAGIRNLKFYFGAGQFYVREKDTDDGVISILVQGVGDCDYYTDGDTLHVESFKGNHFIGEDISENQIIIDIPKGSSFDEVELVCGAGVAEIYDLTANELEIETGAGEVRVYYAVVSKLSANIGAGRVETSEVTAQEVDLEVGMGECIYHGKGLREMDAECGLGNMEIILDGSKEDYNYEIECSAGNIDLGGESFTALAAERNIYNGAPRNFELSCYMGNITVSFEN